MGLRARTRTTSHFADGSRAARTLSPSDVVKLDKNLYDLPPEAKARVKSTPSSLPEALEALQNDHEFLLKEDVFTQDVIDTSVHCKTAHEVNPVRLRPHPYEYFLYYDI